MRHFLKGKHWIFLMIAMLYSTSLSASAQNPEDLIKPGISVGPFNERTTLKQLEQIIGKKNIAVQTACGGENNEPCITIDQGSTYSGLIFYATYIEILAPRFHTTEGLHVGTTAEELELLNASSFKFAGFDIGGYIESFSGGKLEPLLGPKQKYLTINLRRKVGAPFAVIKPLRVNKIVSSATFPDKKSVEIDSIVNHLSIDIDFSKMKTKISEKKQRS